MLIECIVMGVIFVAHRKILENIMRVFDDKEGFKEYEKIRDKVEKYGYIAIGLIFLIVVLYVEIIA